MKLHIHALGVDDVVEVRDADDALSRTKTEAAKHAPMLLRPVVRAMSDQTFMAEAVKRYNSENKTDDPPPASAKQFLEWAVSRGFVTIIEE